jgi:O-antigen/teichoic acid export membrane protein
MTDAPAPPPTPPSTPAADSTMRRDVISAYIASGARVASWFIVSAVLYRIRLIEYAMFALVRSTVGLLNYTGLGIGPAMVRMIAAQRPSSQQQASQPQHARSLSHPTETAVLDYRSVPAQEGKHFTELRAYSNGIVLAAMSSAIAFALVLLYAAFFRSLHRIGTMSLDDLQLIVFAMGAGVILRLISDVPGSVLQASDRISTDNSLLTMAEIAWVVLIVACVIPASREAPALRAAQAYAFAGAILLVARLRAASSLLGRSHPDLRLIEPGAMKALLGFGVLYTIAQLADFLYAPTDFILINRFVDPDVVGVYAPAVQIDSGLLLVVMALANVLFPKTAVAHVRGEMSRVREYYIRGTISSSAMLLVAAIGVWVSSPWLFRIWLGDAAVSTRAILPLVLIHTVIGGSSAVGRSILLGMGKVKPFTVAVLVAGVSNVVLSYVFVRYFHLGLPGIIYGTIIAVTGRCAIWMPWYVLRSLREVSPSGDPLPR